uniref:Uncharacterized protein n=1 Tax=Timema monikensis TaxID=170555 RepID=A0A7R9HS99_9NEOP|nr:unnamed protein product [Timema monikensis]
MVVKYSADLLLTFYTDIPVNASLSRRAACVDNLWRCQVEVQPEPLNNIQHKWERVSERDFTRLGVFDGRIKGILLYKWFYKSPINRLVKQVLLLLYLSKATSGSHDLTYESSFSNVSQQPEGWLDVISIHTELGMPSALRLVLSFSYKRPPKKGPHQL